MALPKNNTRRQDIGFGSTGLKTDIGKSLTNDLMASIYQNNVKNVTGAQTANVGKGNNPTKGTGLTLNNTATVTSPVGTGVSGVKSGTQDSQNYIKAVNEEIAKPKVEPVIEEKKEEPVVEEKVEEETKAPSTNNYSQDNYYKELYKQIKMNSLNSKNEVASAQRKASLSMDNYLKALGIQGTGLGQSQYASLASDYANKISDINKNEQEQLLNLEAQKKAEQDELLAKEEAKTEKNQATLGSQIEYYLSLGLDATPLIEQYKEQYGDASYYENLASGIADKNAKEEAERAEATKEEISYQVAGLYGAIVNAIKEGNLSQEEYINMKNIADKLSEAYKNEDVESMNKYYNEAENLMVGAGNLNESYENVEELATDSGYVNEIKESFFGDYLGSGKSNKAQSKAINKLIEDSKVWARTGTNDGLVINANYGNGLVHLFKFDAKKGIWVDLGTKYKDIKEYKDSYKNLQDLYPDIKNG